MNKRTIKNIISVVFTLIKFVLIKIIHWKEFKFNLIERFSPNTQVDIGENSSIILGQAIRAHSGTKLRVRKDGRLTIGKNTSFNYGCIVTCHKEIKIGEGVEFGPNVLIYDHDHDFKVAGGIKEKKFNYGKVEIGDNVWIGANTVILRGTKIGNNSVIGAGSVIKGEFPDNCVIVQKRENKITYFGPVDRFGN